MQPVCFVFEICKYYLTGRPGHTQRAPLRGPQGWPGAASAILLATERPKCRLVRRPAALYVKTVEVSDWL